jgi:hypothetical protein
MIDYDTFSKFEVCSFVEKSETIAFGKSDNTSPGLEDVSQTRILNSQN